MNNDGMATRYQPAEIENKWYKVWETGGHFAPAGSGEAYAIMIPPPNVTGTLHMGHAFQDTIMDALIRYHRMRGDNTLWQPGSDHAGIATQMVVERQLNAQGKTRHDLGREAFTAKVWEWKAESGGQIMRQLRRLGASLDWTRERFTMDEALSRAVRTLFVKLYDDGLIYRGKRLVNWDPVLKTAISDLEVESREESGFMYHVRYPFVAGQGLDGEYMHIATTRPETILADGALAVHPDDERYRHLLGKMVHVPLTERVIPIIADEYVEMDFGTGCVKITPAHDFNDYAVGQRHTMEVINLMNPDATLNDNVPAAYRGLDRWVAREKIVADLDAAGLLEKVEPHTLKRPYGDRSGVVIEPYLTDQWFVDLSSDKGMAKLTQPALDAVRDGRIKFVPDNWKNTYYNWMENLQDWCISRQLWWGHRIPAWYDADGNVYVAEKSAADRWIYGALDRTIAAVREAFTTYRFDFAAQAVYEFVWNQYCDWYLELVKPVLAKNNTDEAEKARTRHTLLDVLEQTLRLIHPLMPFISEEIWQQTAPALGIEGDTLMRQPYPQADNGHDAAADAEIHWLQQTLLGVRKIRADMNIAPGKALPLIIGGQDEAAARHLARQERCLLALGRLDSVRVLAADEAEPEAAAFMVDGAKNMIPLAGLIDKDAELARLDKEIEKLAKNIARLQGQLGNERFTAKAPPELVAQTRALLAADEETVKPNGKKSRRCKAPLFTYRSSAQVYVKQKRLQQQTSAPSRGAGRASSRWTQPL